MRRNTRWVLLLSGLAVIIGHGAVAAEEPDVSGLYEIRTDGTTQKVKAGDKGKLVVSIKTKNGAHISEEAPLKMELSGDKVKPDKAKLGRADAIAQKEAGQAHPDPKFEVPFTVEGATGKGTLDAKMTFFVCTEKICARQQKSVSLPVDIQQ